MKQDIDYFAKREYTTMMDSGYLSLALREFTNLFTPMWFWKLDGQFNVIQSDCPHESLFRSLFLKDGRREAIEAHIAVSDRPVCFTVSSMLSWIMAFSNHDGATDMYIMGPFFTDRNDPDFYADYLEPMKLSQEAEEILREELKKLSVLPGSAIAQNAVILHFCVRQEKLDVSDVVYYVSQPKHHRYRKNIETNQFEKSSGRWAMEQELLNRIRQGDLSAADVLERADQKHTIHAFGSTLSLNAAKMNIHQLLTLVSRAAVDGGLPQKTSFSLCSEYRDRLERCTSAAELQKVSQEMIRDYAGRVRSMKRFARCSPQIRLCCEYIDTHPGDKLTLEELAEKARYSPFHLSRKFHQEMGCSIIDYIQRSKLERAMYLLSHSDMSVDDISAELGYNSRSYFTTVFKNLLGMTPSAYRRQHAKV